MNVDFRLFALPISLFEPYFSMNDEELLEHDARWMHVDASPGFPCRVTLEDAQVGERVLGISFCHHDANSPYKSSGPIFIRENAQQAYPDINEVPLMLRRRLLSLRGYSADGTMVEAEVIDGKHIEESIARIFHAASVQCIHVHNALPGCYDCKVLRA